MLFPSVHTAMTSSFLAYSCRLLIAAASPCHAQLSRRVLQYGERVTSFIMTIVPSSLVVRWHHIYLMLLDYNVGMRSHTVSSGANSTSVLPPSLLHDHYTAFFGTVVAHPLP